MEEDDECFDLFWTDKDRKSMSNATVNKCPTDNPVLCSEARYYLDEGFRPMSIRGGLLQPLKLAPSPGSGDSVKIPQGNYPKSRMSVGFSSELWDIEVDASEMGRKHSLEEFEKGPLPKRTSSSGDIYGISSSWIYGNDDSNSPETRPPPLRYHPDGVIEPEMNPLMRRATSLDWMDEFDMDGVMRFHDLGPRRLGLNRSNGSQGRRGISNLGLTCYVSATLQVLSHSTNLRNFLTDNPSINPNDIETRFRQVVDQMWDPSSSLPTLNVSEFFASLHASNPHEFVHGIMGDAHEVLSLIMDRISDALKPGGARFTDRVDVMDNLVGISDSQILACTGGCSGVSETRVVLNELLLNIPQPPPVDYEEVMATIGIDYEEIAFQEALSFLAGQDVVVNSVSLADCFGEYAVAENISGYACERCSPVRREANQIHRISGTSEILTLVLRRFEWGTPIKISTPVDIPLELDMATIRGSETEGRYRLVGLVNHHGPSRNGGHYTAIVSRSDPVSGELAWFNADDSSFTPSSFGQDLVHRSSDAYVLVYERMKDDETVEILSSAVDSSRASGIEFDQHLIGTTTEGA